MPTRLSSTGLAFDSGERALVLAAAETGPVLVISEETGGVTRTLTALDFGAATGSTIKLGSLAAVGDKVLIGAGAATETGFRDAYGELDFHEGEGFSLSNALQVDGEVSGTAFISLSDAREKERVAAVTDEEAALVYSLRPVTYALKATGAESTGLLAQELKALFPRAVRTRASGLETVDYQQVNTLLLAALQRLERRVRRCEALI
jgi:hypothetical protein